MAIIFQKLQVGTLLEVTYILKNDCLAEYPTNVMAQQQCDDKQRDKDDNNNAVMPLCTIVTPQMCKNVQILIAICIIQRVQSAHINPRSENTGD